ncbi:MAG: hydrolase 1, exosortase A system-associated [Pseudomonadota bacterium]
MSRLHLTFACGSLTLVGTLDTAPGHTGLLIVSGGSEIRSGAFSGQAQLAQREAQAGFPVFRFDRRGVGDSEGEDHAFRSSGRDVASALSAFRAMAPDVDRVFAFGNCDAASALMLNKGVGFDGLVLSNPWAFEDEAAGKDAAPPPAAIRQRYAQKLKDPSEVLRLLRGGVDLRKLGKGLLKSARPSPTSSDLLREMREGLETYSGTVALLLASADRTAQQFSEGWDPSDSRIKRCEGAGHAYVEPEHRAWLEEQVLAALRS